MCPCHGHPALNNFDGLLRCGLSINSDLSDISWLQSCLPVREEGFGIPCTASFALPVFLDSAAGTQNLQVQILPNWYPEKDRWVEQCQQLWSAIFSLSLLDLPAASNHASQEKPALMLMKQLFGIISATATTSPD